MHQERLSLSTTIMRAADNSSMFLLEINFCDWSPQQLADCFKQRAAKMGGGDCSEMTLKHEIDGKVAHRLKDGDLLQMGVTSVGDRLRTMEEIDKLERSLQQKAREKVIWSGKEELHFAWFAQRCCTCCGCCPDDPAEHSLTGAHLTIATHQPTRCGPACCCCGHRCAIDNLDLSHVMGADVASCSAVNRCVVAANHKKKITSGRGTMETRF